MIAAQSDRILEVDPTTNCRVSHLVFEQALDVPRAMEHADDLNRS
jgi:hypothetical protein